MSPARRFWKAAEAREAPGGWTVALGGRPIRTPAGAPFAAPRAVAEAAAAEWTAQGERIAPQAMPVTRAVNTALDRVAPQIEAVRAELAGYGASDLLCYRAPHPAPLIARQRELWDPLLDWARAELGAALICAEGVAPVDQPPAALAALEAELARHDALALTALHELTALSGSLVLALAVARERLSGAEAWRTSRVDEDHQQSLWGEDAEAAEAAARRAAAFAEAARLLALLRA